MSSSGDEAEVGSDVSVFGKALWVVYDEDVGQGDEVADSGDLLEVLGSGVMLLGEFVDFFIHGKDLLVEGGDDFQHRFGEGKRLWTFVSKVKAGFVGEASSKV